MSALSTDARELREWVMSTLGPVNGRRVLESAASGLKRAFSRDAPIFPKRRRTPDVPYESKYPDVVMSDNSKQTPAVLVNDGETKTIIKTKSKKKKLKSNNPIRELKQRVKKLEKESSEDVAFNSYREISFGRVECAVNGSVFQLCSTANSVAAIEAMLVSFPHYNIAAAGTISNTSLVAGTYSRHIKFNGTKHEITIRNNYDVPVDIRVYNYGVKLDSAVTPDIAFTDGLVDNPSGSLTSTTLNIYPKDSAVLTKLYKLNLSEKTLLNPGQQIFMSYTSKGFDYDPSIYDSTSEGNRRDLDTNFWCVRIQGVLGHEPATPANVGLLKAAVDYMVRASYNVRYDADMSLRNVQVSQTSTLGSTGVTGDMATGDNEDYDAA